jgi:hypothetical protein
MSLMKQYFNVVVTLESELQIRFGGAGGPADDRTPVRIG